MKNQNHLLPAACILLALTSALAPRPAAADNPAPIQRQAVLTVSEGKRLIARAVAEMPLVRAALRDGMVIICKGTTNTYVAEEMLGEEIAAGALVYGRVTPAAGGRDIAEDVIPRPEVVLVNGELRPDLPLSDAVRRLRPGDVVIKGANHLDRARGMAGVLIGAGDSGTTGTILPYVTARKAHLVIPIGLEKACTGDLLETARIMREPVEGPERVLSMQLLHGHIVTEIEALDILADVKAFQAAAGGVGGAEGGVMLVYRGPPESVARAYDIITAVQGEPPFLPPVP